MARDGLYGPSHSFELECEAAKNKGVQELSPIFRFQVIGYSDARMLGCSGRAISGLEAGPPRFFGEIIWCALSVPVLNHYVDWFRKTF